MQEQTAEFLEGKPSERQQVLNRPQRLDCKTDWSTGLSASGVQLPSFLSGIAVEVVAEVAVEAKRGRKSRSRVSQSTYALHKVWTHIFVLNINEYIHTYERRNYLLYIVRELIPWKTCNSSYIYQLLNINKFLIFLLFFCSFYKDQQLWILIKIYT